ncbi:thiamine-phosphate kinase [Flavobacteriaceae bacterium]|nr:thiamine-phosphate kinase [Flavobacteriaceae bacterium]MDA9015708.1 thiamine-phosphate kinase [Flavobacteriaceae bacterium]MDB3862275.1 thiamine-phosphate kinase [Flavobacteriaceae bacterium]
MFEDKNPSKTSLSDLGEFALIDHLTKSIKLQNESSILGIGDDAAILSHSENKTLVSTDLLIEGIHFDLSYMPLKHLGYKAVMVNLSDLYAMNATPTQITVSLAVSNRFTLEALEELYAGIELACKNYKVDLIGGDTTSSTSGLLLSVTALGMASGNQVVKRSGAQENDLLVVSGDLGAAYAGLQVLEREKAVFKANPNSQPDLSPYSYSIERQLKPEARKDIIELLEELNIVPTSMIDISDGLSSEILHLSKSSEVGFHIFEDKLPLDPEVNLICEEFKFNSTTAVLNGGEDYELLFTIAQKDFEKIKNHPLLSVIGHVVEKNAGCQLITGLGHQIELTAQGWQSFENK